MPRPPRVAQVITGLNTGGAETMIMRLIERLDREAFESVVVSLTDVGTIGPRIAELGIDVVALGASGVPTPGDLRRIRAGIARLDLDLVQTWTLYGNVLGGIGARLAGSAPIVWGVHHSGDDLASLGTRVVLTQRFERRLAARLPTRIVACSQSSRQMLAAQRYPQEKVVTILNGFDVKRFHPDPAARAEVRAELGLGPTDRVVGHVARFHAVKGHDLLLEAAKLVVRGEPDARFVLCGAGVEPGNEALAQLAAPLGDRVMMLGEQPSMERMYAAFDLCVSSSSAEALPLAVGEAMATAVPVIATDCGDSADLVGETGRIVPLRDPEALARGISELLALSEAERSELGAAARARVDERYSLDRMVGAYAGLWTGLVEAAGSDPIARR